MKYNENKKRKYPYRYTLHTLPNFISELREFEKRIYAVITKKNMMVTVNLKGRINFYFKNKEDSIIFKLIFSDDEFFSNTPILALYKGRVTYGGCLVYAPYIPNISMTTAITSMNQSIINQSIINQSIDDIDV